jgi:thiamine transport system permease protein
LEKNILLRKTVYFSLLFLLLFPFLHLFVYIPWVPLKWDPLILTILKNSLWQSLLSVFLTLIIGFSGAFGLLKIKTQTSSALFSALKIFLIIPSITPPLIVILLTVKVINFLPFGLTGIVFFHGFMNIGLVALLFFEIIESKAAQWFKESLICGVSIPTFIFRGLIPGIKKEIIGITLYFFILFFFSFSIPLILGGTHYGGPEVLIMEKIFSYGEWGEALQYSMILFLILFIYSTLNITSEAMKTKSAEQNFTIFRFLKANPLLILNLLPSVLLLVGILQLVFNFSIANSIHEWLNLLQVTFMLGLSTGVIVFIMLSIHCYCFLNAQYTRWIDSLMNPSWVILGFSLLLLPGDLPVFRFIKISFGLSILFFPFLLRLVFNQKMQSLTYQVRVAEVFQVSWAKTYWQIIFPQCLPSICFLSGLAGLWACGDFALSGILLESSQSTSLALEMKSLISSYRMDKALLLLWPLLLCSITVFLVFQGIGHVCRRKIIS